MTIGNLQKVPNSEQVTRIVIYEALVTFSASWKAKVFLYVQNDHLVGWHFESNQDQWRFQEMEVVDQQLVYQHLLDQNLLKISKQAYENK